MTTLGHSPPRSRKESFAASSFWTAGSIVADLDDESRRRAAADAGPARTVDSVDEPAQPTGVGGHGRVEPAQTDPVDEAEPAGPDPDSRAAKVEARAAGRSEREMAKNAGRQARIDAKQVARARREAATQTKRDAKAEKQRKRFYAKQHDRMRHEAEASEREAQLEEAEQAASETPELTEADEATTADERDEVDDKAAIRQERREARTAARSAKAKPKRDRIVEPPREPKVSLLERRRQKAAQKSEQKSDQSQETTSPDPSGRRRTATATAFAAIVIGAIGLVCSLILALGAFLVALGAGETNGTYELVSGICNVLVGPLRDVFTFSGTNAEMKETVVAWGLGSMGYVLVGLFAQSYLRSGIDD